ncbi:uncharacterized protein TRAVEDRAFT_52485 [Trametes versicolor FP-101664 SS1]|uniref:uncharacterized protein n=1 Tax=Trametes versicolor (strain FP-101664) TaxID=717944 RepID=UPI0004623F1C|nr:uncharacterized protein TRAVEDRAFT_52485 [Trametes versicolor FP-101664 SS1]EIW53357.1 hypothetical protein TRAVEDRAFT_52485 [Trametes versicolor FP-101664 SS1]
MAQRPKVPAALHSELTEYSSLLRALRTSNTLDLVQHLAEPPSTGFHASSDWDDVSLPDEDHHEVASDPPLTESASQDLVSNVGSSIQSHGSSQSREQLPIGKAKQKDNWTRWPLLAGDVHVPEWGLHDEVRHAAQEALTSSQDHHGAGPSSLKDHNSVPPFDEEEREHPALSPPALRAMTADSAAFLTRILALLAAHVPNTEKSMQNRLRPIDWETVIDVACTHGVVSANMAERVRERMSRLYPLARPSTAFRVGRLSAANTNLIGRLAELDASLFVPAEHETKRRPKRSSKKREASADANLPAKRQRSEDGG